MSWLQDKKAGDVVVVSSGQTPWPFRMMTIERMTRTQAILKNGMRFRLRDAGEVGASEWSTTRLHEPTPANKERARLDRHRRMLSNRMTAARIRTDATVDELRHAIVALDAVLTGDDE